MRHLLWLYGTICLLACCTPKNPEIRFIDLAKWQTDRHGCTGYRSESANAIFQQKEKLLGLTENQVLRLLGKPDAAELYRRNQKIYYYSLTADSTCSHPAQKPLKLALYFNATGRVKEVLRE